MLNSKVIDKLDALQTKLQNLINFISIWVLVLNAIGLY